MLEPGYGRRNLAGPSAGFYSEIATPRYSGRHAEAVSPVVHETASTDRTARSASLRCGSDPIGRRQRALGTHRFLGDRGIDRSMDLR